MKVVLPGLHALILVWASEIVDSLFRKIGVRDYKGAHTAAIARLRKNGRDANAVCTLGLIAFDHGNSAKGIELLETACRLDPEDAHLAAQLARALTLAGRQADARQAADHAAQLRETSNDERAHVNDLIGVVYSRVGLHERAVPFFRRAVAADPRPANHHYNLAASLQFSGAFDDAERAYLDTLERDPDNHRAMSSLAALRKQTQEANSLTSLTEAFDRLSGDADAALHIGHAVAKTLEDLGRYPDSLDWLERAKAAKAEEIDYRPGWDAALLEAAAKTASSPHKTDEKAGPAPIFVTGLPRTGTTLVERILSSHPTVRSVGELNAFADAAKRASGTDTPHVLDPETFAALDGADLSGVGDDYMRFVDPLLDSMGAPQGSRSVDKMPLNILCAGLIHRALPNARIIVLRRGAMDSCLSNYRQLFSTGHSYYNYSFDLEHTAAYYAAFDRLVARLAVTLPEDRFLQIRYEDIVFDQEAQTRRLLGFCGLDWDERCLRFHENDAPVSTASSVQVRQPLYSGSIGRWTRYGDRLEGLRSALGALAET